MKQLIKPAMLAILSIFILAGCSKQDEVAVAKDTFGAPLTIQTATNLADVYANPAQFEGKEIKLEGTIAEVCQKKGCWLKLQQGEYDITVRFKDYAFFVPKDAASRTVAVQGYFIPKTDKHVEEEAAAQKEVLETETEPSYSFTASGVEIAAVTKS